MNQFLSNKIIAGIVALALLAGVGVLVSSGDTSSTTRNAALVVATPCTKLGQVTKVSKQSVVCATTNTGSLWYATMKAKGKAQACTTPGEIRKKSDIVWVCGVVKKKKLWQATQPLPPAVVAPTAVIEPSASQPTPALDSTKVATPVVPVVADNAVLADTKIPDDKIVTKVIDAPTTPTVAPSTPTVAPTTPTVAPTTPTVAPSTPPAIPRTYQVGETGPGGGIVFYVASKNFTSTGSGCNTTCKYLEAAPSDQSQTNWCSNDANSLGVSGMDIGSGMSNTTTARSTCNSGAIQVAADYSYNGKDDWHLPSTYELDQLYEQKSTVGAKDSSYWSSSEVNADIARSQHFYNGQQTTGTKGTTASYVRPVRAF